MEHIRAIVENTWGPHVFQAPKSSSMGCCSKVSFSEAGVQQKSWNPTVVCWTQLDSPFQIFEAVIRQFFSMLRSLNVCVSFLCSKRFSLSNLWTDSSILFHGNFHAEYQIWYSYPSLLVAGIIIVMVAVIPISTYVDLQWNPAAHNMTLHLCSHVTGCGW